MQRKIVGEMLALEQGGLIDISPTGFSTHRAGKRAKGYANGIAAKDRLVFLAGQVG